MSHTPYELAAEFRQDTYLLHRLKMEDKHFAKLADAYHEVNREFHRIESEIENTSDEYAEMQKKKRLALVDEIGAIISRAKASA